ncbi:MAG TPA: glutamate 5-kinase, partial [Acidimicrobiales bacterium]|nr:glutamate 5-kinase [Acidimicrobiales bacterium]
MALAAQDGHLGGQLLDGGPGDLAVLVGDRRRADLDDDIHGRRRFIAPAGAPAPRSPGRRTRTRSRRPARCRRGGRRPTDIGTLQALAAIGQPRLMERISAILGVHGLVAAQVLLTPYDFIHRTQYLHARQTLRRLLDLGAVPVVNENDTVADDEIRYGDNDRLAALVAHLVHADLLLLLSDVDGLYDGRPGTPGVTLLSDVVSPADLERVRIGGTGSAGLGSGGMQTKVEAARIATGAGIPVVLTSAAQAGVALAGE